MEPDDFTTDHEPLDGADELDDYLAETPLGHAIEEGDEMSEPFEDDIEEFERNQVAADHEGEELDLDDETPLGHAIEERGELLDE